MSEVSEMSSIQVTLPYISKEAVQTEFLDEDLGVDDYLEHARYEPQFSDVVVALALQEHRAFQDVRRYVDAFQEEGVRKKLEVPAIDDSAP